MYTELTLQEQIAGRRGIVRNFEAQMLEATELLAVNRALKAHYSANGVRKGSKYDAAVQTIAQHEQKIQEVTVALPILRARLDALVATLPPDVDEEEAPTDTEEESDTVAAAEKATEPEPVHELSRAEVKQRLGIRKIVDTPAEYSENGTKPEPVQV